MTRKIVLDLRKLLVALFALYICYIYCNNDLYRSSRIGSNMVICFAILLLAGIIILYMRQFNILFDNIYIKFFSAFFIYIMISYVWTDYYVDQFYVVPFMICDILLVLLFWNVAQYIAVENIMMIFIIAGCLAASKMLLTVPVNAYGVQVYFEGIGNRNMLGMCLSFSAAICFCMYLIKKSWCYLGIMIYLYYAALMAGSKKGILLGAFIILIGILLMRFSVKKAVIVLVVSCLFMLLYYILMNNTFIYGIIGVRMQTFIRSLGNGGEGDVSTHERLYLLRLAPQIIMERPIFGWGMNGFTGWVVRNTNHRATYSHNNYTEVLANFGIAGFVIYYWVYFSTIVRGIKISRIFKKNYASIWGTATVITMMGLEMACVTYYEMIFQAIIIFAVIMVYQYGYASDLEGTKDLQNRERDKCNEQNSKIFIKF